MSASSCFWLHEVLFLSSLPALEVMYKIPVEGFGAGLQQESLALCEPWWNSCMVSCCAVKWFSFVQGRDGIQRLMEEFSVRGVSSIHCGGGFNFSS